MFFHVEFVKVTDIIFYVFSVGGVKSLSEIVDFNFFLSIVFILDAVIAKNFGIIELKLFPETVGVL